MAMRLTSVEAHNVQRVRDVRFDMKGHNLFLIGGGNMAGKTSVLTAMAMAICGKSGMDDYPPVPLTVGQDEGHVRIKLEGTSEELHEPEGLTIELKLLRKRGGSVVEEFRVLDSAGEEAPEPRTLLKRMFQLRAFDPLAFARMKPAEQRAMMERLLKLDFTAERQQYKELYDERTIVNREAKAAKARFDGFQFYPDVVEQSATELLAEIDRVTAINAANDKVRKSLEVSTETLEKAKAGCDAIREEIARLQKKLEDTEKVVVGKSIDVAMLEEEVAGLKDHDTAPLRAKMKTIEADNAKARSNAKRKEALDNYNSFENKAEFLTRQMAELEAEQKRRLAEAKFPVEGMSLEAGGILLNGLPFEQASQAERIMASVDVGIALNPELRLMICKDGNAMDAETIAALDAKLEDSDFQMIVEVVTNTSDDEDRCAVVIKDGKVVKTNKKPASAGLFEGDDADVDNAAAV